MSLTRANVETILISRVGTLFDKAGMDGTTVDGSNTDLNDPIGYALRKLSYTVADPTSVADGDVDDVSSADYDALFDVAEVRALENGHLALLTIVSITVGPRKQEFSDMAKALGATIAAKRARIDAEYGLGSQGLEAGVIHLDFQEKGD